jgi:cellulose biosynthesis protein BcsQ
MFRMRSIIGYYDAENAPPPEHFNILIALGKIPMFHSPSLPRIILFCQEERGSGKSLLAANAARILANSHRVLVIDCTWNGNLTEYFGFQFTSWEGAQWFPDTPPSIRLLVEVASFFDCFTEKICLSDTFLRPAKLKNLRLSPSGSRCRKKEIENQCQNPFVFQRILEEVEGQFDFIIVDFVSDSSSLFSSLAMVATDILIPVNLSPRVGTPLGHGFIDSNVDMLLDVQDFRQNPPRVRFVLNRVTPKSDRRYWRRELESSGIGTVCEAGIRDYQYCKPRYCGLNRFHRGTTFMEDVSLLLSECGILANSRATQARTSSFV